MAKKHNTIGSMVKELKKLFDESLTAKPYIPSIIEFCESKANLGLPNPLYPVQALILKAFYRGTPGNENLQLSKEEIEMCRQQLRDIDEESGDVLKLDDFLQFETLEKLFDFWQFAKDYSNLDKKVREIKSNV